MALQVVGVVLVVAMLIIPGATAFLHGLVPGVCKTAVSDEIKVMARDPEDLERFLMHDLLALGVVRSSTTHFVLRQTKYTTAVPLD